LIWHERNFEAVSGALDLDGVMAQVAVDWPTFELAALLTLEYPDGDRNRLGFVARDP
jgi:hypothetical protein